MNRQRGAVLMLVLVVLASMSVLAFGMCRDALLGYTLSSAMRSSLSARLLFESGKALAATELIRNNRRGDQDTLNESWSRFNDALQELSRHSESGDFSGAIVDENSLFPLNALFPRDKTQELRAAAMKGMFTRLTAKLLRRHGFAGTQEEAEQAVLPLLESLEEWAGLRELSATAREWYLSRPQPLLPPERRLVGVNELTLLRWPGMAQELAELVLRGTKTVPGLLDLVSVYAPGPINLNTARPELLYALLPNVPDEFVEEVLRLRSRPDFSPAKNWHLEIARKYGMALENLPGDTIDLYSRWYRLELDVRSGAALRSLRAVGWVSNTTVTWEVQAVR